MKWLHSRRTYLLQKEMKMDCRILLKAKAVISSPLGVVFLSVKVPQNYESLLWQWCAALVSLAMHDNLLFGATLRRVEYLLSNIPPNAVLFVLKKLNWTFMSLWNGLCNQQQNCRPVTNREVSIPGFTVQQTEDFHLSREQIAVVYISCISCLRTTSTKSTYSSSLLCNWDWELL